MSSDTDDPAVAETLVPSPEDQALRERPHGDTLVRQVAKNKIAAALFATNDQTVIGRYRLLERVGVGGMGVVWGAWDPQLERRVALKLVKVKTEGARDRMLAEGQTLAKLSHPNVVPIYDVGTVDDQIYLVMEWIRGDNLRAYCKQPRTTREIIHLYRAAGDGLVAAHREGIIHRDFKPDNVMVGEDGRVRVLDFGLARTDGGAGDDVAGTPRYMAPEQARGETLTAAVDQFAFCVSLRESLSEHDGTVPGWVAAIVARATAPAAGDRYPSMDALLHALARDPQTVWRRRVLALGALAAAGGAFAVGTMRSHGTEPCAGSADELARVWNPAVRATLLAHGRTLGPYGVAESQYLDDALTAYAQRWAAAHRGACLARRRGEVTERLYENGLACIMRARGALRAVTDVLGRATINKYPDASLAARALPDVDRCIVDATDSAVAPPDRSIAGLVTALSANTASASYLALAGDPKAIVVVRPLVAAAEQLGYQPLIARARLALGSALALQPTDIPPEAVSSYAASAAAALASFDDVVFVEAVARELFAAGRLDADELPAETRDVKSTIPFADIVAKRSGAAGKFARTLLYNNAGTAYLSNGDPVTARTWFRKAHEELRGGANSPELWVALGNLAMVVEGREERDALFADERANLERALGLTHAFTLRARLRAAGYVENRDIAMKTLVEICDALAKWYPHQVELIAKCRYEVGWLADEVGDTNTARTAYSSVVASSQDEAKRARAQLALLGAEAREAERSAGELAQQALNDASWFSRFPGGVDAFLIRANARLALGNADGAIADLRAALAILEDARMNKSSVRYQRRLARVQAELAFLLTKRDPSAAKDLAAKALVWCKSAGGYDDRVRALEAITTGAAR